MLRTALALTRREVRIFELCRRFDADADGGLTKAQWRKVLRVAVGGDMLMADELYDALIVSESGALLMYADLPHRLHRWVLGNDVLEGNGAGSSKNSSLPAMDGAITPPAGRPATSDTLPACRDGRGSNSTLPTCRRESKHVARPPALKYGRAPHQPPRPPWGACGVPARHTAPWDTSTPPGGGALEIGGRLYEHNRIAGVKAPVCPPPGLHHACQRMRGSVVYCGKPDSTAAGGASVSQLLTPFLPLRSASGPLHYASASTLNINRFQ